MNDITKNLTIENYNNLKSSFSNAKKIFWDDKTKKLVHPGEYGQYREEQVKKWIQMHIPERFGISSGFIISSNNYVSTQCDIIIYDKLTTPKIENIDRQKFFPIEIVLAVGEIKSDIKTIKDLNKSLIKLTKIKKERENVKNPSPYRGFKKDNFNPKLNPR